MLSKSRRSWKCFFLSIGDIIYNKDFNKTFEYYQKAADLNYSLAYLKLGVLYSNGNGVKKDYNKAVELFRKAINDGETIGYKLLGYMYKDGKGVEQNYSKSADCFKKAAEECNDSYSMFELSMLYNDGKVSLKIMKWLSIW